MPDLRVTINGRYIQKVVHDVLDGFEMNGLKGVGSGGPWKAYVEFAGTKEGHSLSVDSEGSVAVLLSVEDSVKLFVELVVWSEVSLSDELTLDLIHACQKAFDKSKAWFLHNHEYPTNLVFIEPYPSYEVDGIIYGDSHRFQDAKEHEYPNLHKQPDFGKVYSSEVEAYRSMHVEEWNDTRPFQHFSGDLATFKEFPEFATWDEIHVSLRSDSDYDPSFGNQIRGEIVTEIVQTQEDFKRVNYLQVDPASYLQRIITNYENSSFWQSFE